MHTRTPKYATSTHKGLYCHKRRKPNIELQAKYCTLLDMALPGPLNKHSSPSEDCTLSKGKISQRCILMYCIEYCPFGSLRGSDYPTTVPAQKLIFFSGTLRFQRKACVFSNHTQIRVCKPTGTSSKNYYYKMHSYPV